MQHLQSFQLFEYLGSEHTQQLYRYFHANQQEREQSLPFDYQNEYQTFLWDTGEDDEAYEDIKDTDEVWDYIYTLQEANPALYTAFGQWLHQGVIDHSLSISDEEYPTWSFFDYRNLIKANTWLLHFTNREAADYIAAGGFTRGVLNIEKLGLTEYVNSYERGPEGYTFAYTVSDAIKYNQNVTKYGDGETCLMFRAAGVRASHGSDNDEQVIFSGVDAKDLLLLVMEDEKWIIRDHPHLVKKDNLYRLVQWVEQHYDQYRARLRKRL